MATQINFFYNIQSVLDKIQTESLFFIDGTEKTNFNKEAINLDDIGFVSIFLEESANEVFIMLHKWATGIDDAFVYAVEVDDQEGDHISYLVIVPQNYSLATNLTTDNFDINLKIPLDKAILRCLVNKTLWKWFDSKGLMTDKINSANIKAENDLRKLLNYRIKVRKTYNMY